MSNELQDFLRLPYAELEELNLHAKEERMSRVPIHQIQEERLKYLTDEKRIKAVTLLFSDLEGRLHMLDYDKKFLLKSWDNMTFDGSSIRGFTAQKESDLRLGVDWSAFYWGPADVFGAGKVMVFGDVIDKEGGPYGADLRAVLKAYANEVYKKEGYTLNAANEIEGFLFDGVDAERRYHETGKFEYVSAGGYYHSLPGDTLRLFIDGSCEAQRAMGFQNEKDHPEVAPSQFEINYGYAEVVAAADQIQIYKLICRQVAKKMGLTACFLPKPIVGVNGTGMHTNVEYMARLTVDSTELEDVRKELVLKGKLSQIQDMHTLATTRTRCFRQGIVRYFQEEKPALRKSLALRIVQWLFSTKEKPVRSKRCCDKCDSVTPSNYALWVKSVFGH